MTGDTTGHTNPLEVLRRRRRVPAETLRSRLWPLPAAAVLLVVLAGIGAPELDIDVDDHMQERFSVPVVTEDPAVNNLPQFWS